MDRVVPAVLRPDRPGGAGVPGPGGQRVVGALAVDLADRVDRRQVDHVEAHAGDRVEALGGRAQGPAGDLAGRGVDGGALGPREELVPAAVERPRPVREDGVRTHHRQQVADRVRGEHRGELGRLERREPRLDGALGVLRGGDGRLEHVGGGTLLLLAVQALEHPLEEQLPLGEHQVDVDTGRDLEPGGVLPGPDRVGPGLDLEGPPPGLVGREPRVVPVRDVGVLHHLHRRPSLAAGIGRDHLGAELVVTLAEHAGGHRKGLADRRLRREVTAVDGGVHHGRDVHDGDASDHASTLSVRVRRCKPGPAALGWRT